MRFEKNSRIGAALFLCGWVIMVSALQGCGKKGPPVPPAIPGQTLMAPRELKGELRDGIIHLTWQYGGSDDHSVLKPETFELFTAEIPLDGCEGCPLVFGKTGTAPMPSMRLTQPAAPGRRYTFKVRAVARNGMVGEFSRMVQIDSP